VTTPSTTTTQTARERAQFLALLSAQTPPTTTQFQRAALRRRARQLNLTCALPTWLSSNNQPTPNPSPLHPTAQALLQAKAHLTGYPTNALALAYLRALNDTTPLPPGHTRDDAAQARVNSLISLADCDPAAPTHDADLLPLMSQHTQHTHDTPPKTTASQFRPTAVPCLQAAPST
jgi:hypothetical protein